MRLDKEFQSFLDYDKKQDYYYRIDKVNVIQGKNNENYYEIFVNGLNDFDCDDKDFVIVERFFDYLNDNKIKFELEYDFDIMAEYVSCYDIREYMGVE